MSIWPAGGCQDFLSRGVGYQGGEAKGVSGAPCIPWAATSHSHLGGHNYCRCAGYTSTSPSITTITTTCPRNPSRRRAVWCHTGPSSWEYCPVPWCGGW